MKKMMWGYLVHLGENMWNDRTDISDTEWETWEDSPKYRTNLLCDEKIWDAVVEKLPEFGIDTLLIDLGDGIIYDSHPELAISGSWDKEKLLSKLDSARSLGLTVYPKLNFSTCHDAWLKEYSRSVSTPVYYSVVDDLIREVCELFDGPSLFHIGMDEETWEHQKTYAHATVRTGSLWWEDLYYYAELCDKNNCRPWVWSDKYWTHPEEFTEKMPRDILQSNWYYGGRFRKNPDGSFADTAARAFTELDRLGFEQIPTGSNWSCRQNMELLVDNCKKAISPDNLSGFMMAPWAFLTKRQYYFLLDGAARLAEAKRRYY